MNVYTYSEARQQLACVLEQAAREGEVRIRRKDGQLFVIQLQASPSSPLDVEGLDLGLGADEIVQMVREGDGAPSIASRPTGACPTGARTSTQRAARRRSTAQRSP